ncbi:MAG TPA: hypothetical protein VGL81_07440 [Polyangiaceae bacterium]|jgi:hypothetical protein
MTGTKGKLLLAVLIVAGAAWFLFRRPGPPVHSARPVPSDMGHAAGIDHSMAAIIALQRAPEGNSPCESAYNAFKASKDVSDSQGVKAVVYKLAPRDEFLVKCSALPAGAQACLVPRYMSRHHDECDRARASPETLSPFVELLQKAAPIDENEALPVPLTTASAPAR